MRVDLQASKKHRRFDVVWNAKRQLWEIAQTNVVVVHESPGTTKRAAVKLARQLARNVGDPAVVFTHDRNGRIGKGGNAEASFRCDSKRRPG